MNRPAVYIPVFAFAYFVVGIVIALIFAALGALLTATLIGAIIGIPMMLAAVVLPFVAPFMALFMRRQACPHCQHAVFASRFLKGVTCRACRTRLVMRGKQLIAA